jgi:hypothetical protein
MMWNSSADMGMTRSQLVFDDAMTSSAITSPLARCYCRTLRWGQFNQFLDVSSGVPQHLDVCPFPEGGVIFLGQVPHRAAGALLAA